MVPGRRSADMMWYFDARMRDVLLRADAEALRSSGCAPSGVAGVGPGAARETPSRCSCRSRRCSTRCKKNRQVGAVTSSTRLGSLDAAALRRAIPGGLWDRSRIVPTKARISSSSSHSGLEPNRRAPSIACWISLSRSSDGGFSASVWRDSTIAGEGRPYSCSPVLDGTEVIDSTRSGCSMARRWTIMPPRECPRTWTGSLVTAVATARASSAKSIREYSTSSHLDDKPLSRRSNRTTWKPRSANISHHDRA